MTFPRNDPAKTGFPHLDAHPRDRESCGAVDRDSIAPSNRRCLLQRGHASRRHWCPTTKGQVEW